MSSWYIGIACPSFRHCVCPNSFAIIFTLNGWVLFKFCMCFFQLIRHTLWVIWLISDLNFLYEWGYTRQLHVLCSLSFNSFFRKLLIHIMYIKILSWLEMRFYHHFNLFFLIENVSKAQVRNSKSFIFFCFHEQSLNKK